ncbi:Glycosyltransferase [Clostridiaceae bacterium JG1575]|nr:Glycosyltransferase [Clostridiaceae bacterium JG1575]
MLISVVVPMYKEEAVARECHRRLSKVLTPLPYDSEIIYVNDGSSDGTGTILNELQAEDERVRVIHFSRNFGHQNAVTAGILNACGDAVILIDADLQDPPELIAQMVETWQKGYEVVYGERKKRAGERRFKLATARWFYQLLDQLSDTKIPKNTGDFRLMDRSVVEAFRQMPEKNKFIRGMVSWVGFRQTALLYERKERFAGETHYPLRKMLKLALDGILSFSTKPLKLVAGLGFVTVLISFIVLIYSILQKFFGYTDQGWTSLMTAVTFFAGVQLISLGIIGEYIGRIYDESRDRPNYIIADMRGFQHAKDAPFDPYGKHLPR